MSEEAEQGVIGSILLTYGKALEELTLHEDDFASPRNAAVYALLRGLYAKGRAADLTTAGAALQTAEDHVKRLVTPAYLYECSKNTPTSAMVGEYQRIVKDAAVRRRLVEVSSRIVEAVNTVDNLDQVVEEARALIDNAGQVDSPDLQSMADTVDETIKQMQEPARFVPTPWADLNH